MLEQIYNYNKHLNTGKKFSGLKRKLRDNCHDDMPHRIHRRTGSYARVLRASNTEQSSNNSIEELLVKQKKQLDDLSTKLVI